MNENLELDAAVSEELRILRELRELRKINYLYIHAGRVVHTRKELAALLGKSIGAVDTMLCRWRKTTMPLYLIKLGIDDHLTSEDIFEIRKKTYDAYLRDCDYSGREVTIDPPPNDYKLRRGCKSCWPGRKPRAKKVKPPSKFGKNTLEYFIENKMTKSKGPKFYLVWIPAWDSGNYFTNVDIERNDITMPGKIVYKSNDLRQVNREQRRLCAEKDLWYPGRPSSYIVDGVLYKTISDLARALGVPRHRVETQIKKCRYFKEAWPTGWSEVKKNV